MQDSCIYGEIGYYYIGFNGSWSGLTLMKAGFSRKFEVGAEELGLGDGQCR